MLGAKHTFPALALYCILIPFTLTKEWAAVSIFLIFTTEFSLPTTNKFLMDIYATQIMLLAQNNLPKSRVTTQTPLASGKTITGISISKFIQTQQTGS